MEKDPHWQIWSMIWYLHFRLWSKKIGCLDLKLWPCQVGYLNTFFHNLVKFSNFSRLPFLQVTLISWLILDQMPLWTIFPWIIGHDEHFLSKKSNFDFRSQMNFVQRNPISWFFDRCIPWGYFKLVNGLLGFSWTSWIIYWCISSSPAKNVSMEILII